LHCHACVLTPFNSILLKHGEAFITKETLECNPLHLRSLPGKVKRRLSRLNASTMQANIHLNDDIDRSACLCGSCSYMVQVIHLVNCKNDLASSG
jgi:hypothetical protein